MTILALVLAPIMILFLVAGLVGLVMFMSGLVEADLNETVNGAIYFLGPFLVCIPYLYFLDWAGVI